MDPEWGFATADTPQSLAPDGFTFRAGVTTAVDPSTGWKDVAEFRRRVIGSSLTRVLMFIFLAEDGISGTDIPEQNLNAMDPKMTALTALAYVWRLFIALYFWWEAKRDI